MLVTFEPNVRVIGKVQPTATIEELSDVNSVYAASPKFAIEHCGKIVEDILAAVPERWYKECKDRELLPNIDVRVHRLYRGIYPAYPGWHCDAEFRESYFAQPDLDRTPVSRTIVCTVSSHECGVSKTEFLLTPFQAEVDTLIEPTVWRQVHEQIETTPGLDKYKIRYGDGQLIEFCNRTLHRATPAVIRGWRLFFRMSMWHRPYLGKEGQVSKQEQVYSVLESQGW